MRAIRFHEFGEPEVLRVEQAPEPHAGVYQVRVKVHACGLNPADWAVVRGLFGGTLPQGIGLEVSGVVDEVGGFIEGVAVGDRVFGPVQYGWATGGAAEYAVLSIMRSTFSKVPEGLDMKQAAGLPMAAETAWRGLDLLGVADGETVLVHGAGGVIGGVAVQLALVRGARVIATAGPARTEELRSFGAEVTAYGEGMGERIAALAGGRIDRALDVSPVGAGELATLVKLTGDPKRVLTMTNFAEAAELGAIIGGPGNSDQQIRYDVLDDVAALAAKGSVTIPIGRTFALDEIGEAAKLSQSGRPGGKLLLLP